MRLRGHSGIVPILVLKSKEDPKEEEIYGIIMADFHSFVNRAKATGSRGTTDLAPPSFFIRHTYI